MLKIIQQTGTNQKAKEAIEAAEKRAKDLIQIEKDRDERDKLIHEKKMKLLDLKIEYYSKLTGKPQFNQASGTNKCDNTAQKVTGKTQSNQASAANKFDNTAQKVTNK